MKKILVCSFIIIFALVMVRFMSVKKQESDRAKTLAASAIPMVKLGVIGEDSVVKPFEIPGRIESSDKVDLVARIDGYLQKKHFKEGDFVKKGQVLLTIEPTQYLNNLNKAKADLESAKAASFKANRDYDRGAELVEKDFISKSTYDGLYADKLAKEASVKAAQAALAEAQRNYSYTTIESPVDGKVGSLNIQEGNYVTMQSGTLATVVKTNPIYVKYSIDSKQHKKLKQLKALPKKGEKPAVVEIILSNNEKYEKTGVQDFYDNQISLSTGTMDFRATFENSNNILIPGDFVKVIVKPNIENNYVIIPQEHTLQDAQSKFVYAVVDNKVVKKRFEDMGEFNKGWIVKEENAQFNDVKKGDKYIISKLTSLMEGMQVKVQEENQTAEDKK